MHTGVGQSKRKGDIFIPSLFQIFTNEDFKKIRLTKIVQKINPKAGKKRKHEQENTEPSER